MVLEVSKLCGMLGLEDARTTSQDKVQYTGEVKRAFKWKDETNIKEKMEEKKDKKMRTMYYDKLELKDYVRTGDLYTARVTWDVRSHMLRVAGNYPGQLRYGASGWKRQACSLDVREDQEHLASCTSYANFRARRDLTLENESVGFFKDVMARRKAMGWD